MCCLLGSRLSVKKTSSLGMLSVNKRGLICLLNVNKRVSFKSCRYLNSKIPSTPFELPIKEHGSNCITKINQSTVAHLERLSLVDFGNEKGIQILEDAIAFADQITTINTEGVEPMVTVLENRELRLREDIVTEGNCCKEILSNASITEEDYFVAPPGNIPVAPKTYQSISDIEKHSKDSENLENNKLRHEQSM